MLDKKLFDRAKELLSGVYNIFSHSIIEDVKITDTYAMIDTGAVYKHDKKFGTLTALHYPTLRSIKSS